MTRVDPRVSIADRFWAKVDKNGPIVRPELGPCWIWIAHRDRKGYGEISMGHQHKVRAPRVSWEMHYGPIPDGKIIRHHCDNPPCIRPDHLALGTKKDNSQDAARRGRWAFQVRLRGEQSHLARLTLAQVKRVRLLSDEGWIQTRIAKEFGVTQTAISGILTGRTWKASA